jgi:hypothetical protein
VITIKILAEGLLPVAPGVLYTVPAGASAIVMDIGLTVAGSAPGLAGLFIRKSGSLSVRSLSPVGFKLSPGTHYQRRGRVTMSAGDTIEGYAVYSGDYVISGIERT